MHFNLEEAYACIECALLKLEYLSLIDKTGKKKKMWEYTVQELSPILNTAQRRYG